MQGPVKRIASDSAFPNDIQEMPEVGKALASFTEPELSLSLDKLPACQGVSQACLYLSSGSCFESPGSSCAHQDQRVELTK